MELDLPPVGSKWYYLGEHYSVERHTTRDGEPAVRLKLLRAPRAKFPRTVCWSLMAKKAVESGA